ncbi:hypothetical protein ACFQ9X_48915 [Catenulispora yoronensis]
METLESKVNGYLHANARGRATNEACGPFHIGFDADNGNPFLNYAVPEPNAEPTPEHIAALIAAFEKRDRTPRLEFAPGGAPGVEEALKEAGFEDQQRLPFMIVTAAELVGPLDVDGVEVVVLDATAGDEELRGVAQAQWEAFVGEAGGESGESGKEHDGDFSAEVAGLRSSLESGKFAVLARGAAGRPTRGCRWPEGPRGPESTARPRSAGSRRGRRIGGAGSGPR